MVKTKYGLIEGIEHEGYTEYRGIPYAKPPVGALRWKAPQEPQKWDGVLEAKQFAAKCPQEEVSPDTPWGGFFYREFYADPAYNVPMDEDCLYLNIYAPNTQNDKKLPVAFWIHGGGFGGGYGCEMEFDGAQYCKRDVILVTIQYRLNIFGFLAHPWLDAESETNTSGNYGILDQIAALKWVHENIEAFGGDPDNITVFGQSAGSMSTQVLISSDLTKGMIRKAIMQSGIAAENQKLLFTPTLAQEEEVGELFVRETGASNLEELRALPWEKVLACKQKFDVAAMDLGVGLCLVPNADGILLKDTVKECYRKGEFQHIPYMLGCVIDDLGCTPDQVRAKEKGPLYAENEAFAQKCDALGIPAYVYYMPHELHDEDGKTKPAFHSAELWYTFGTYDRCWREMDEHDRSLSESMLDAWTAFMKTSVPGSDWQQYTKTQPFVKVFE